MPLVIFVGIPSSGKTKRALELKKYLEDKHQVNVALINEETLSLKKNEVYKDVNSEKMLRGFLRSNVEKNLNDKTVVILDSQNYIKGFRYELFCLVRTVKTTHCVVYMDVSKETAKKYNEKQEGGLCPELFEDYCNRMEVPNAKSIFNIIYLKIQDRWDSPLFQVREYEETPVEEITQVILFDEKTSKDPVSTKTEIKTETNFVHELDKRVQDIIDLINEKQNGTFMKGTTIVFDGCKKKLTLHNTISLIELKKFKKEFSNMCKQNPLTNVEMIGDAFITYLEAAIQRLN